jgi:putative hydrolase of the HAD superfamily
VWQVFPDVEDTLREARARALHIGVISNWDERLRPLLTNMGLVRHFDSMTISCEVGAEKPDGRMFHTALQSAGVAPDEAVHIGDSATEDVRGAEAVGMRAVLLDRQGCSGAGARDLQSAWSRVDEA